MHKAKLIHELRQLPADDRHKLINQLWAELNESESFSPLTDVQRQVLDQRLEAHLADAGGVVPWDEARDRVLGEL